MSKLKRFQVEAEVTVSAYTVVYAKNQAEAIEIAEGRSPQLAGCGWTADECWLIEEADGSPREITVGYPE